MGAKTGLQCDLSAHKRHAGASSSILYPQWIQAHQDTKILTQKSLTRRAIALAMALPLLSRRRTERKRDFSLVHIAGMIRPSIDRIFRTRKERSLPDRLSFEWPNRVGGIALSVGGPQSNWRSGVRRRETYASPRNLKEGA